MMTRSDVLPDGEYGVTVQLDDDRAMTLDSIEALTYVCRLNAVRCAAEYDAAVLRQLGARGLPLEVIMALVVELRAKRTLPTLPWPGPIRYDAGVALDNREPLEVRPFLVLLWADTPDGQLDAPAAAEHALAVLEAISTAQLDAHYLEALRELGLDEPIARAAVGDLLTHRPPGCTCGQPWRLRTVHEPAAPCWQPS